MNLITKTITYPQQILIKRYNTEVKKLVPKHNRLQIIKLSAKVTVRLPI